MNYRNSKSRGTVHSQSYVAFPLCPVAIDVMRVFREVTMRLNASPRPEIRLP